VALMSAALSVAKAGIIAISPPRSLELNMGFFLLSRCRGPGARRLFA
jgi:hypothetical protein